MKINSKKKDIQEKVLKIKYLKHVVKGLIWFCIGAILGLFLFVSFLFIIFQNKYKNKVYPGVMVNNIDFSGKSEIEVESYFLAKNNLIKHTKLIFTYNNISETISAEDLKIGYNTKLLAKQAYSIGRSNDILSNIALVFNAYINGVNLQPSYYYNDQVLENFLKPISEKINIPAVDALFNFQNGKVTAFRPSSEGQAIDIQMVKKKLVVKIFEIMSFEKSQTINIPISITTLKPKITTDKANNLGIKELIGSGTSLFQGSIPNRIYNVTLASTRIHGILVAPNEIFSFNKALGDVSSFTGYKQAYVIQNGRTVLGDGGGVCQVSTTLFRAIINTGLPIAERNAHAYRVGYYEQDSEPGLDATIFVPSVDLKFKNDTNNYILIQAIIDPDVQRLTFNLYGTKDNRMVKVEKPIITAETSPPAPLYQDDPTLNKGVVKQIDFPAWGANVYFTREVTKNGKIIISDKFVSNYRPWQAVFLKGTKE